MCNFAERNFHGSREKKTKKTHMISEDRLAEFDRRVAEASCVAVSTHAHPDGDAVGSSVALAHYLLGRGKDVRIVMPDPCPENLQFALDDAVAPLVADSAETAAEALGRCDLLISIDYNSPGRTDALEPHIRDFGGFRILIDHHLSPETGFYGLTFSKCDVSSSCEVLYGVLLGMPEIDGHPERLGIEACTALMLGMTTDSNNFANSTYPSTLEMAGRLIAAGVDRDALLDRLYRRFRENRFRFMGHYLQDRLKITGEGVAYAVMTADDIRKYGMKDGETEGFVNMPLGIENVRMSIFVKEEDSRDRLRVSVRSKNGTSANLFAGRYFNGGGHELAAGGRLAVPGDISGPEEVPAYIEKCAGEFFGPGEKTEERK